MKKVLAVLCALAMLLSLAACGAGAKPEATVSAFLDAMKTFDLEAMNACTTTDQAIKWDNAEQETDEMTQQLLDVFKTLAAKTDYTIGETKVEDEKATVNVTLQYADAAFLAKDTMTDVMAKMVTALFGGEGEAEIGKLLAETLQEKIATSEIPQNSMDIAFPLEKGEDGWRITLVPDELINAMTGNIAQELSDIGETLTDFDGAEVEQ